MGVIIGAVMIGRDVQRNAEYTRIKQKFVDQWVVTYNSYHQRYGSPVGEACRLGGGKQAPEFVEPLTTWVPLWRGTADGSAPPNVAMGTVVLCEGGSAFSDRWCTQPRAISTRSPACRAKGASRLGACTKA